MIETKVPMDVRSYKTKYIGPFTLRQLICITIAAGVDIALFLFVFIPLGLDLGNMLKPIIFILALVDTPIIAFIFEPQGMPMEDYLKYILIRGFVVPAKRKAVDTLPPLEGPVYTDKELKESKKKMKALLKSHPEFRAYK